MTRLTSRRQQLSPDLQAAAHNLLSIQADLLRVTRDLREQGELLHDDVAKAVIDTATQLYDAYPPLLALTRELIERHRP